MSIKISRCKGIMCAAYIELHTFKKNKKYTKLFAKIMVIIHAPWLQVGLTHTMLLPPIYKIATSFLQNYFHHNYILVLRQNVLVCLTIYPFFLHFGSKWNVLDYSLNRTYFEDHVVS